VCLCFPMRLKHSRLQKLRGHDAYSCALPVRHGEYYIVTGWQTRGGACYDVRAPVCVCVCVPIRLNHLRLQGIRGNDACGLALCKKRRSHIASGSQTRGGACTHNRAHG